METLDEIRARINSIDTKMAELFEQRMEESRRVVEYKMANGLSVSDPVREAENIRRNSLHIKSDTVREYYVNFEKALMAQSCDYQRRVMEGMKVACCSEDSALAAKAAASMFPGATIVEYSSLEEAYAACQDGACDSAVLPVESSVTGYVAAVTDLLFSGSLVINQVTGVDDGEGCTTRFAAFSRVMDTTHSKSRMDRHFILVFSVRNEAGSLAKTLNIIGAHGFNMVNLHSRPMQSLLWNYYFFLELDGDVNTTEGQDMLRELGTLCDRLKLVGSFKVDNA